MINEAIEVKIIPQESINYTNEMADILCQQINDNVFIINAITSLSTQVYHKKTLVFTLFSDIFIHLSALNAIDREINKYVNEYTDKIKKLFGDDIDGMTLNIKNYNHELIFNEYYEI